MIATVNQENFRCKTSQELSFFHRCITTTHNREAIFFFGETRPVISGTTATPTSGGTASGFSTQSNITPQEIGTKITVKPLIGTDGTVQLDIKQDISDVTGSTYTYLINGHGPRENWTGLFRPGERVRLRIINASAMSFFDVRIPGLKMNVVQSDGQNIEPLKVDEFRFAPAETYDVVVTPQDDKAYTIAAEPIDRTGFALGTLAPREGMKGDAPTPRPRALLLPACGPVFFTPAYPCVCV